MKRKRKTPSSLPFECIPRDVIFQILSCISFGDAVNLSSINSKTRSIVKQYYAGQIQKTYGFPINIEKDICVNGDISIPYGLYGVIIPTIVVYVEPYIPANGVIDRNAAFNDIHAPSNVEISPLLVFRIIQLKINDNYVGNKPTCQAGSRIIYPSHHFSIGNGNRAPTIRLKVSYVYNMTQPFIFPELADYFASSGSTTGIYGRRQLASLTSNANVPQGSETKYNNKIPVQMIDKMTDIPKVVYLLDNIDYYDASKDLNVLYSGKHSNDISGVYEHDRGDKFYRYILFGKAYTMLFIYPPDRKKASYVFLFQYN